MKNLFACIDEESGKKKIFDSIAFFENFKKLGNNYLNLSKTLVKMKGSSERKDERRTANNDQRKINRDVSVSAKSMRRVEKKGRQKEPVSQLFNFYLSGYFSHFFLSLHSIFFFFL